MSEPHDQPTEAPLPAVPAPSQQVEPLPPGGRSERTPRVARGAVPDVVGAPPVTTVVPIPARPFGTDVPGVLLAQRPRRRGDSFGWPANAAPGKPEGEVDTRP